MKPKTIATICFCFFFFVPILNAQNWSRTQLEALHVLQAAVDAVKTSNIDALVPLYHENFVAWNYGQPKPVAKKEFLEAEASALKKMKFNHYKIDPISITVTRNVAVINVSYDYAFIDDGKKTHAVTGKWSAVLVNSDSKWLLLSCFFKDN
jgi:hypothetical protein